MKKVMIPLVMLLLAAGPTDLFAMKQTKKHHKKTDRVENAKRNGKKKKKIQFIEANGVKIPERSIKEQTAETLIPLFIGLHSQVTVATPKEEGQKIFKHTRAIRDRLTEIFGDKKTTNEAVDGIADDFTDEETHMNAFWQCETVEEITDPQKIYLGYLAGNTSVWKYNIYENMKNKNQLCEKYGGQIAAEESSLKALTDQICEMQKKAQEQREKIKKLNTTKNIHESKLKNAEGYSSEIVDYLDEQIEDTIGFIETYKDNLEKLDLESSELRNKKTDAKVFTAQISKIKEEKEALQKKKAKAEITQKELTEALDHVNQYLPKAREEGSLGRRLLWGKSF